MIKAARGLVALPLIGLWLVEGHVTGVYPPRRMEPIVKRVLGT